MLNFLKKHKYSIRVLFDYNLIIILVVLALYFTVPTIMNYLPETINTQFDVMMSFISYRQQYLIIMMLFLIITNPILLILLKSIFKLENEISTNDDWKENKELISKVRKDCYKIPYTIFLIQLSIAVIVVLVILVTTGSHDWLMIIKVSLLVLTFDVLATVMSFILSKRVFTKILVTLPYDENNKWFRISLKSKMLMLILPMLLMALLFTSLVGYTRISYEKGNILHDAYEKFLFDISEKSQDGLTDEQINNELNNIEFINKNHNRVIIYEDETYKSIDDKGVTDFIIKYTLQISNKYDGKIMDSYGKDIQGVMKRVYNVDKQQYCYIGVIYDLSSPGALAFLLVSSMLFFILNFIVLRSVSNEITNGVTMSLERLQEISENRNDYTKSKHSLKVISNDEMGELAIVFNKIQELTNEYINEIHDGQETLMEKDRLASLGQLMGGIAHNLKTPIMSISGNLQGLQDLITEYNVSVGDPEVTTDDHKAIANDMQELVDKTRIHLSYMSDVITAVKGQAVQLDSSETQIFGALEVASRIEILMKHELKSALVEMKVNVEEEAKTGYIKGDINSLVQVLNNLVQNAIYASKDAENKVIYFDISKQDNKICFKVQDNGCGIPQNIQEKLFKEMVTTKGKNGTGLGLYMSYSTIRGKFNGTFEFESKEGEGTTFYIKIPVSQ